MTKVIVIIIIIIFILFSIFYIDICQVAKRKKYPTEKLYKMLFIHLKEFLKYIKQINFSVL